MLTLTKLQNNAIEKFKDKDFGALFMDVGTGKTQAALEIAKTKEWDILLYITKNSLKSQVSGQLGGLNNVIVSSYESIAQSNREYLKILGKLPGKTVFVIADESSAIKNETKTTNRLMNIRNMCKYALIITATPITNDELDLYNQINFLSRKILNMTKGEFIDNFYDKITYRKLGEQEKSFIKFSDVNKAYLQQIIDLISIQGKLEIDFKIKESFEHIEPTEETTDEFNEAKEIFLEDIMSGKISDSEYMNFLTYANKVFALDENKNKKVAEKARGKCVVFCSFRKEQEMIAEHLDDCLIMNGDTKNRDEIIDKFNNSNLPLIITYGVGGLGLNLQSSNRVIFSSLLFDWEKVEQAKGRIARLGQESGTLYYDYVLTDCKINKYISNNLGNKDQIVNLVREIIDEKI